MIERREGKITKWHWKKAAKGWRHRAKWHEQDRLGFMRREIRAYTCLQLIAESTNWPMEMIISTAKRGLRD